MKHSYAMIGSRNTPLDICELFIKVAYQRAISDWAIGNSGGAIRADSAMEFGVWTHLISEGIESQARDFLRVFLPRVKFNGRYANKKSGLILIKDSTDALELTSGFHPAWSRLSKKPRDLMARNAYQVLSKKLDAPVSEVLCWTPDGSLGNKTSHETGGTGQALRLAYFHKVPIVNAYLPQHRRYLTQITQNVRLPFTITHEHLTKVRGYHESKCSHFF